MILKFHTNRLRFVICRLTILFLALAGGGQALAQNAVLKLRSGDTISGVLVSVGTNQLVISNAWAGRLSVPVSQIADCKAGTNVPASVVVAIDFAKTNEPATALVTGDQPAISEQKHASASPAKPKQKWRGQVNVGLDALASTKTQQSYFGKLKLTYLKPYHSESKKFFRNTTQLSGQYQRTDGQESANRASGNNKTDFDLTGTYYGYSSAGAGYDKVRKIDFQYQVGPGLGKHLIRTDEAALNLESGIEYEAQYRQDAADLESFFLRLAEDWDWKIRKNLGFSEKFAFYPNLEPVDAGQYRFDFTSTLSYGFWQNLSLDLTLDNSYNTQVVQGVERNEFEARLPLGATF